MSTAADATREHVDAIPETLASLVVPIGSVTPYPRNPRRGSIETLRASLEAHGQYRPLVVNRRTQEVLAGNQTLRAAVELGWHEVAVTYVDVDDEQAARIVAIDNRASDLATYDDRELADLLASLDDLGGTGYEQDDLDEMLASLALDDEAAVPDETKRERYSFDVYSRERVIETAATELRASGFPYKHVPLQQQLVDVNDLAAMSDSQLMRTRTGYAVADTYHPHRMHARVGSQKTALDVYESEELLRVAIGHALTYGLAFTSLVNVMTLTHGAQVPSNFRPGFAALLLRRYAPDGATVLDTSAGYGGRLVGFFSSHCSAYIDIDPATETQAANDRLVAALLPDGKSVTLLTEAAEDVDATSLPQCDVAVTSPPYFSKERYSDEATQSWVRYPSSDEWRAGFLRPMLELQHAALKPGAFNVVNIADVDVKGKRVPLVDWTIEDALATGFALDTVEQMPLTRRWGPQEDEVHTEPVLVFVRR